MDKQMEAPMTTDTLTPEQIAEIEFTHKLAVEIFGDDLLNEDEKRISH